MSGTLGGEWRQGSERGVMVSEHLSVDPQMAQIVQVVLEIQAKRP